MRTIIFLVLPLVALLFTTLFMSAFLTGGILADVNQAHDIYSTIMLFSAPMIFYLVIIPLLWLIFIEKKSLNECGIQFKIDKKSICCMLVIILFLAISIFRLSQVAVKTEFWIIIMQFFAVAISEEVMIRGIISKELSRCFSLVITVLISAICFAFVYHSNMPPIDNLLFRFPLGILLSFIYIYTNNITCPILSHFAYNIFIITL
jgi:hypothetical protein